MKIATKVIFPVGLLLLVASSAVVLFAHLYLEDALFRELFLERRDDIKRNMEFFLRPESFKQPGLPESQEQFQRFIASLKAPDVVRITFWNTDFEVIASDLEGLTGKRSPTHKELPILYAEREARLFEKQHDDNTPTQTTISPLFQIMIPLTLEGKFYGVVEMHVSNTIIGQAIHRNVLFTSLLFFSTGVVVFFFLFGVLRYQVVGPLRRIIEVSERIQKGDWDAKVLSAEGDEIGDMARAFETMRGKLKDTFLALKEKQEKAERAERQVTDRLQEIEHLNELMVGRELRMAELKKKLARYETKFGKETEETLLEKDAEPREGEETKTPA